jgi:hypothetical protein
VSVYARRRLVALGAAIVLAAGVAVAVAALVGGGDSAPATGTARLVPASALAFVHLSTDAGRAGTRRAAALLRKFPTLEALGRRIVGALSRTGRGLGVDYGRDIAPWIGNEAALALVDVGNGVASSEIVVGVHDRAGARGFLGRLGRPARTSVVGGVEVSDYGGQAVAFVSGYLVTGPDAVVREAIALGAGHGAALADAGPYRRAIAGAPAGRVLDAYASAAGVRRVLAPSGGLLGALGTLLGRPGLEGAYLAVTARAHSAEVHVHEALAPGARPPAPFAPTLAAAAHAPAVAFLDATGLDRRLPGLLALARSSSLTAGLGPLLGRIAAALRGAGVDLRRDVAPLVAGETAVILTPNQPLPTLTMVARTSDEARARTMLASLQGPLARVLGAATAGSGTVPTFTQHVVAGAVAYRLRINPALEVDYAVANGRIVVSTSLNGIAAAMGGKGSLAGDSKFRSVIGGPKRVTSVLFLDLDQLLRLGAQTGLDQDPQFLAVRKDLRRVHAVGLTASSGEAQTTAELSLQIP